MQACLLRPARCTADDAVPSTPPLLRACCCLTSGGTTKAPAPAPQPLGSQSATVSSSCRRSCTRGPKKTGRAPCCSCLQLPPDTRHPAHPPAPPSRRMHALAASLAWNDAEAQRIPRLAVIVQPRGRRELHRVHRLQQVAEACGAGAERGGRQAAAVEMAAGKLKDKGNPQQIFRSVTVQVTGPGLAQGGRAATRACTGPGPFNPSSLTPAWQEGSRQPASAPTLPPTHLCRWHPEVTRGRCWRGPPPQWRCTSQQPVARGDACVAVHCWQEVRVGQTQPPPRLTHTSSGDKRSCGTKRAAGPT